MSPPIYLIQKKHFDSVFGVSMNAPAVFFAYEDGAFTTNAPLRRATSFKNEVDLIKAMDYAKESHPNMEMIPVHINITTARAYVDKDDFYRRSALSKLTENEKRVLGL